MTKNNFLQKVSEEVYRNSKKAGNIVPIKSIEQQSFFERIFSLSHHGKPKKMSDYGDN